MLEGTMQNAEGPMYIIYSSEDGRILATYTHFDADMGTYVRCGPEDVLEASLGASPDLESGDIEVLEMSLGDGDELADMKVDLNEKTLVPR